MGSLLVASLFIFASLLVLQEIAANEDNLLLERQTNRLIFPQVLPFIWHAGMWGDVILTVWFSIIIWILGDQWAPWQVALHLSIGFTVSFLLHQLIYRKASIPEAHAKNGRLTVAGWLHLVYMGLGIAVILLFFFHCHGVAPWFVVASAVILWAHLTLAHHIIPAAYCEITGQTWYMPRPWRSKQFWIDISVTAVALTLLSLYTISRS